MLPGPSQQSPASFSGQGAPAGQNLQPPAQPATVFAPGYIPPPDIQMPAFVMQSSYSQDELNDLYEPKGFLPDLPAKPPAPVVQPTAAAPAPAAAAPGPAAPVQTTAMAPSMNTATPSNARVNTGPNPAVVPPHAYSSLPATSASTAAVTAPTTTSATTTTTTTTTTATTPSTPATSTTTTTTANAAETPAEGPHSPTANPDAPKAESKGFFSFFRSGSGTAKSNTTAKTAASNPVVPHGNQYQMAVVGGGSVGKSCLTIQYVKHFFVTDYDPTIEDSYRSQVVIDGAVCVLNIMDTAGQDLYSSMRDHYFRSGEGFLIVYSVTTHNGFDDLDQLHAQILRVKEEESVNDKVPMVLVANKIDLTEQRVISTALGQAKAKAWGCPYVETSAKNRINVDECFAQLVREIRRFYILAQEKNLPHEPPRGGIFSRFGCILL